MYIANKFVLIKLVFIGSTEEFVFFHDTSILECILISSELLPQLYIR